MREDWAEGADMHEMLCTPASGVSIIESVLEKVCEYQTRAQFALPHTAILRFSGLDYYHGPGSRVCTPRPESFRGLQGIEPESFRG
jgi:hypothetical protein